MNPEVFSARPLRRDVRGGARIPLLNGKNRGNRETGAADFSFQVIDFRRVYSASGGIRSAKQRKNNEKPHTPPGLCRGLGTPSLCSASNFALIGRSVVDEAVSTT